MKQLRDRQSASISRIRSQNPDRGGAVYLIHIGEMVKIGRSVNPDLRIKQMQLPQTPDAVEIFPCKLYAESVSLERALHERYAAHREHGEWFSLTEAQVAEASKFSKAWLSTE